MTSDTDTPASRLVIDAVRVAFADVPASPQSSIAVAFSGGLDSTALLDAALRCAGPSRVIALHIHHGLSPNADAWAAHCHAFAQALGVRFASRQVDVVREGGESLEAAARDARYRALDALCEEQGASALWLAHHADDQAETVLLQLLRGAGVAGLAAMAPQRADGVPTTAPAALRCYICCVRNSSITRTSAICAGSTTNPTPIPAMPATRCVMTCCRRLPYISPVSAMRLPGPRRTRHRRKGCSMNSRALIWRRRKVTMRARLSLSAVLAFDDERAINLLRYWMRSLGLLAASAARISEVLRQLRDAAVSRDGHALRIDHAGFCLRGVS